MKVVGMKYLKELPAIVSDARATFHGRKDADIRTATSEINAGIVRTFESKVMFASASYVKTTNVTTAVARNIDTVLPRKRDTTL